MAWLGGWVLWGHKQPMGLTTPTWGRAGEAEWTLNLWTGWVGADLSWLPGRRTVWEGGLRPSFSRQPWITDITQAGGSEPGTQAVGAKWEPWGLSVHARVRVCEGLQVWGWRPCSGGGGQGAVRATWSLLRGWAFL